MNSERTLIGQASVRNFGVGTFTLPFASPRWIAGSDEFSVSGAAPAAAGRCRSLRTPGCRRCLRHFRTGFAVCPEKTSTQLFLLGELLWHRQACAGTSWQPTSGTCSVLLDAASLCHASPHAMPVRLIIVR
ncbi:hypothetical protein LBMAG47_11110 [Planctomycetia bacterium]|nr:hypothetical protein LBMAG47_11110 [Planctomycetia bacterium]